ncbi:MAG: helix-turn-helix domain-containing protein [Fermentimonas sp.]|nr:helix-turn-helix domain-containing protein [Fermentimonas sp.]
MKEQEVITQQYFLIYASVITVVLLIILLSVFVFSYFRSAKKNRGLIDLVRNRSGFFRNITHEFRTPLTVILGFNNELKTITDLSSNESKSFMDAIERLSVSTSQLNRKLTAVAGHSPSNFISRLRIEYAKTMLENGEKPIGEIAEECGYYDLAYFSRTFKKMTKFSPSQYRRLRR